MIDFFRQLATLLRAGIPLREAILSLRETSRSAGLRAALQQIVQDIEAGQNFSAACGKHPTLFPTFFVRLVQVGEAGGGGFTHVLGQAGALMERRKRLVDRLKEALIYPAMILVIGAIAGTILLTYSIPGLLGLISEFGGELPTSTRLLMNGTQFVRGNGGYMFGGLALTGSLAWLYIKTRSGTRARDRLLLRLPVIGKMQLYGNMFSLMSNLGTLLASAVPLVEALQLAAREMGNVVFREGAMEVAARASQGVRPSSAFADSRIFPPLVIQAIRSGEIAGNLSGVLSQMTDYYEGELNNAVAVTVEMIQPVVTVGAAVVVGFVAVAVFQGIYATLSSIA